MSNTKQAWENIDTNAFEGEEFGPESVATIADAYIAELEASLKESQSFNQMSADVMTLRSECQHLRAEVTTLRASLEQSEMLHNTLAGDNAALREQVSDAKWWWFYGDEHAHLYVSVSSDQLDWVSLHAARKAAERGDKV